MRWLVVVADRQTSQLPDPAMREVPLCEQADRPSCETSQVNRRNNRVVSTRTDRGRQAGAAWLLAAIVTLVICVAIAAIGYPIGPRFLGTLGVAGIVAPVLLALRWSRERGRQTTPCEARQTTPVRSTQSDRHTRRASSPAATWLGWV